MVLLLDMSGKIENGNGELLKVLPKKKVVVKKFKFDETYNNITYNNTKFEFKHDDLHWENIMIDNECKLNIIDPYQSMGVLLSKKQ